MSKGIAAYIAVFVILILLSVPALRDEWIDFIESIWDIQLAFEPILDEIQRYGFGTVLAELWVWIWPGLVLVLVYAFAVIVILPVGGALVLHRVAKRAGIPFWFFFLPWTFLLLLMAEIRPFQFGFVVPVLGLGIMVWLANSTVEEERQQTFGP